MRIGIISVNNAHNFGTCMQAYAFKSYLESLGHEVQIINHRIPKIEKSYMIYKKKPGNSIISKALWDIMYLRILLKKPYLQLRHQRHERFFEKYYNMTEETSTLKELRNMNYNFDVVFAGSDQIWNDEIIGNLDPAFFCDFVGDNTIKASYAASIGKNSLTDPECQVFKKYLRELDFVSVREEKAKECLKDLTDNEIKIVLDPTLIANKNVYEVLLKKPKFKKDYIYVHVHHYSAKGLELVKAAKELSKRTGLPVVHNLQDAKFDNELGKTRSMGPEDVLTTIANAKIVVTQSFHVTVFSLIFNKNFITLARDKFSDRMENLLKIVGLSNHYIQYNELDELPLLENDIIDYEKVNEKLAEYKQESINYINSVLNGGKKKKCSDYFETGDKFNCFGCSLCKDVCPVKAITMNEDEEGFVFPVIDEQKCISCGLCKKKCIYNFAKKYDYKSRAYFSYHLDNYEREHSTSGGMFAVFSEYILNQGGFVVGVKFNEEFEVTYDIANTKEECMAFRYSKYVEPKHNDIYSKTKQALMTGKPVLFTGSPCKIAGLKNYLDREYDNLYLIDIICECTSSPLAFRKYLAAKEKEKRSKIVSYVFRSKEKGWKNRATEIKYEDTSSECVTARNNVFYHCFVSAYLAKRSCFNCHFCGDNAIADITIGDFWNSEKVLNIKPDDKGYSAIKIGSEKGMHLLNSVENKLFIREVTCDDIFNNNHAWPVTLTETREVILKEINECDDTISVLKKYNPKYKNK